MGGSRRSKDPEVVATNKEDVHLTTSSRSTRSVGEKTAPSEESRFSRRTETCCGYSEERLRNSVKMVNLKVFF